MGYMTNGLRLITTLARDIKATDNKISRLKRQMVHQSTVMK